MTFVLGFAAALWAPTIEMAGKMIRDEIFPPAPQLRFHVRAVDGDAVRAYVANDGGRSIVVHRFILCPPETAMLSSEDGSQFISLLEWPAVWNDHWQVLWGLQHIPLGWEASCQHAEAIGVRKGSSGVVPPESAVELDFEKPIRVNLLPYISTYAVSRRMEHLCPVTLVAQAGEVGIRAMQLVPCDASDAPSLP